MLRVAIPTPVYMRLPHHNEILDVLCCMLQQSSHTAVVHYTDAYPPSLPSVKLEPGLQQVKMEYSAEYTGDYYAGDEENDFENYNMYYDQAGGMYTDPGESYSATGHFADNSVQIMEHSKPRAPKVYYCFNRVSLLICFIWQIPYYYTKITYLNLPYSPIWFPLISLIPHQS